jgi:hypothetical protein
VHWNKCVITFIWVKFSELVTVFVTSIIIESTAKDFKLANKTGIDFHVVRIISIPFIVTNSEIKKIHFVICLQFFSLHNFEFVELEISSPFHSELALEITQREAEFTLSICCYL